MKPPRSAWWMVAPCFVTTTFCVPVLSQVTQRVSVSSSGAQGDYATGASSVSADGRFVAIEGNAGSLVPLDTNGAPDVLVRDRLVGLTELVSVDSNGVQANAHSDGGFLSADGRFVSFSSYATNLVPNDTNGAWDGFVRDRLLGATERITISSSGMEGNGHSFAFWMTPDGRYVLIDSDATTLVPGTTYAGFQTYLRDRQTGTTERVSVAMGGGMPNNEINGSSISANGRFVAFWSAASNLVPGDTNNRADAFVYDRQTGANELVSIDSQGGQANGDCIGQTAISADGRYVAFLSWASNLVSGDTNGWPDIFLRDRQVGTIERVNVGAAGEQANDDTLDCAMSPDARFVVFRSYASNLVPSDTNGTRDVFVRDRETATTERVSVDSAGAQGNGGVDSLVAISADGRFVAFTSSSDNLVPGDTNQVADAFLRDRVGGTSFSSMCYSGIDGVTSCPCSNAPSETGRGCNNSADTGGAILSASGGTYLSSDSLVFNTSGQRPTALSIVTQWTGSNPTGVIFGQGVRCTSGTLKRLYTKTASGGGIAAPNFVAGDPQVSVRSATLGDTILAGQSRWYLVYYRDPVVLGGCPASSTFNCTQTGQVSWAP